MTSLPDLSYEPSLLARQSQLENCVFESSYTAPALMARAITDSKSLKPAEKMALLKFLPDGHPEVLDARSVCGYYCRDERPELFTIGAESIRKLLDDRSYRGYVHTHRERLVHTAEFYGTPWLSVADTPEPLHSAVDEIHSQLDDSSLSHDARRQLEMRRAILAPKNTLRSRYTNYPLEVVERLSNRQASSGEGRLAFTVTTCRRLSLLKESMNAFLNCCLDLDMIDTWVLVDDNSSGEDRAEMRRLYPFFHFIERGPAERGHAKGLNILWKLLEERGIEHVFHMEDDRVFLRPKEYVRMGLDILRDSEGQGVAQVVYSRNYSDSWNDWYRHEGRVVTRLNPPLRYVVHRGHEGEQEPTWSDVNVEGWPHFSLNPSLIHLGRLRRTSSFEPSFLEEHETFEFEFATRYARAGFKSAFPDDVFVLHIGKLHSEQHTLNKDAYQLNRHSRFGRKY